MAEEQEIRDKQKLKSLCERWTYPEEIITKVFIYFGESFDQTDEFLDIIDAYTDHNDPWVMKLHYAWYHFTTDNNIEHEADPCPFHPGNLTLSDFDPSDGIGECELIIREEGGFVKNGMIEFDEKNFIKASGLVHKAAEYLCNEWDYSFTQ